VTTPRFALLVPVKDGPGAKTRLGEVGDRARAGLMAAFARDAVTAALRTPQARVYVVGDPAALRPLFAGLDVTVVPDEGAGDLNRALARASVRIGTPGQATAAMLADLPCLRPDDLEEALTISWESETRCYVADAAGTGTTLLAAPPGEELDPRFGRDSARAHAASGAQAIGGELASLRLDVDTTGDLRRALRFGVGPHTAGAATALTAASLD
jgi:2-phospho-L-lactate/phosphoenolpyruvate guanylyltransferase